MYFQNISKITHAQACGLWHEMTCCGLVLLANRNHKVKQGLKCKPTNSHMIGSKNGSSSTLV